MECLQPLIADEESGLWGAAQYGLQSLKALSDPLASAVRVAWLPPEEDINSGPRLRDLVLGDPRRPSARRGDTAPPVQAHAPSSTAGRAPYLQLPR